MIVKVRYFAAVRARLGVAEEAIEVAGVEAQVSDLWEALSARHPWLSKVRDQVRVSVNLEFAQPTTPLHEGDEVALIPPVAGGHDDPAPRDAADTPAAVLCTSPLDPATVTARVARPEAGAVVSFTGVVRDHARGRAVSFLEYEVYEAMAAAKLTEVQRETEARWPEARCALCHRHGRLEVGEVAVVIAVSAPHRAEAFAACAWAIERVKEVVPIWKREVGPDGSAWVGMGS